MIRLIAAALGSVAFVSCCGVSWAQAPTAPISFNYRGEPVCPSNYIVRGNVCVNLYAGQAQPRARQAMPETAPIQRNYRGELACPSNYVIRGNACVSSESLRARGLSSAEQPNYRGRGYQGGYDRGGYEGGGYGGGGYRGGYRDDFDDDDRGPPRRSYRGHSDVPQKGTGARAVQPIMTQRGPQCPSNYVIRGGLCVSIY